MKKRVKLFTTIASLCMAVALMAFGVYAAKNTTVTVNSTVQYDVGSNVIMEFSGKSADSATADHLALDGNETKASFAGTEEENTDKKE